MNSSIKIRSQRLDDMTEIKLLISHPMENGRNRDALTGELIPAHFIRELNIDLNGSRIMTINLGQSMSKNPFFSFHLKNAHSSGQLRVHWNDNLGDNDSAEYSLD